MGSRPQRSWHFEFQKTDDFTLEEHLHPRTFLRRFDGKVTVDRAPDTQTDAIVVDILLTASTDDMLDAIQVEASENTKGVVISDAMPNPDLSGSTLSVAILVKSEAHLENFKIDVHHLGIDLSPGLRMSIEEVAVLSATSSCIVAAMDESSVQANSWDVRSASGGIAGSWSALKYTSMSSSSGNIDIKVVPGRGLSDTASLTNDMVVVSGSGKVRVDYNTPKDIPIRNYHLDIGSSSGSISGTYVFGDYLKLKTSSGTITATIIPQVADKKGQIITETVSGGLDVTVLPASKRPHEALRNLSGRHVSNSGSINLRYPQTWEGEIDGRVVSGSLSLTGRDVQVESDDKGVVGRRVRASKGKGNGEIDMQATSGSIRAQIGDV